MKYFDLYSGISGFSCGLSLDWKCVGFAETNKYACQILSNKYPRIKNYGDVEKINIKELPDFDVLTLSPPSGGLCERVYEIVSAKVPRAIIIEIIKQNEKATIPILERLSHLNYASDLSSLNTKDYNIPLDKSITFIVSYHMSVFKDPEVFTQENIEKYKNTITPPAEYANAFVIPREAELLRYTEMEAIFEPVKREEIAKNNTIDDITSYEKCLGFPKDWTKYGTNEKGEVELKENIRQKLCDSATVPKMINLIARNLNRL